MLCPSIDGFSHLLVTDTSRLTRTVGEGDLLVRAVEVAVEPPQASDALFQAVTTLAKSDDRCGDAAMDTTCKDKLMKLFGDPDLLEPEKATLPQFLSEHHEVFSIDEVSMEKQIW